MEKGAYKNYLLLCNFFFGQWEEGRGVLYIWLEKQYNIYQEKEQIARH
jgi:hypothetical protein